MNSQYETWLKFFDKTDGGIYTLCSDFFNGYSFNGITIDCIPDVSSIHTIVRQADTQKYEPLYAVFKSHSSKENAVMTEIVTPPIKLLDIPIYAENGFRDTTVCIKPVTRLTFASGWYINKPDKPKNEDDTRLLYRSRFSRNFYFTNKGEVVSTYTKGTVDVFTFLSALSGLTFKQISEYFPFPQIKMYYTSLLSKNPNLNKITRAQCCEKVLSVFFKDYTRVNNDPVENLNVQFFKYSRNIAGKEKLLRLSAMESYQRFLGYKIKEVILGDKSAEGEYITSQYATKLDTEIKVYECVLENTSGNTVTVKRKYCESFTRNLSVDEIFDAYYQYLLFLNGIGEMHDNSSLANLIAEPIDKVVSRAIEQVLTIALNKIESNISSGALNPFEALESTIHNALTNKKDATYREERKNTDIIGMIKSASINRTLDITNTISEVDTNYKIKCVDSSELRDVHHSHYGRIDMNDTPESKEVGLTLSLAVNSKIDEYGFITTPVYKVTDGVVDKSKKVYINYLEEEYKYIAPFNAHLDSTDVGEEFDLVEECTYNGTVVTVPRKLVSYRRCSAEDAYGSTLGLVPLLTSNGSKRFSLASSGYKQAMPLINGERPFLSTGYAQHDAGVVRVSEIISKAFSEKGLTIDLDAPITITFEGSVDKEDVTEMSFDLSRSIYGIKRVTYNTMGISRSISNTHRHYSLNSTVSNGEYKFVVVNGKVTKDDIVLHSNDISVVNKPVTTIGDSEVDNLDAVTDHDIAVGQNVKVLFKTFEGFGYEDSVQLNERFVNQYGLAAVWSIRVEHEIKRNISSKSKSSSFGKVLYNGKEVSYIEEMVIKLINRIS